MPIFTTPDFNLLANVWSAELNASPADWPFAGPTRAADFQTDAQLYIQQRVSLGSYAIPFRSSGNQVSVSAARIDLRVPLGTSIRYPLPNNLDGSSSFDVVECPAGSGSFYFVIFAIDVHLGFPNAYRMAVLIPYVNVGAAEDADLELIDVIEIAFGSDL